VEFCWRAQEAGWALEYTPQARVEHLHVERLRPMLRKTARWAAGRAWVNGRYPGSFPRPRLARALVRSAGGALVWTLRGRFERALFKLIDGAWALADFYGYVRGDNRAVGVG
jgi:GT2 family glycosyltransferase